MLSFFKVYKVIECETLSTEYATNSSSVTIFPRISKNDSIYVHVDVVCCTGYLQPTSNIIGNAISVMSRSGHTNWFT